MWHLTDKKILKCFCLSPWVKSHPCLWSRVPAEARGEEGVMVAKLIKKEKDWDDKRKECVEAKCFDKYFVLVCVRGDPITGAETLPSYWLTYKERRSRGLVDWKRCQSLIKRTESYFIFFLGSSSNPMWFYHIGFYPHFIVVLHLTNSSDYTMSVL